MILAYFSIAFILWLFVMSDLIACRESNPLLYLTGTLVCLLWPIWISLSLILFVWIEIIEKGKSET